MTFDPRLHEALQSGQARVCAGLVRRARHAPAAGLKSTTVIVLAFASAAPGTYLVTLQIKASGGKAVKVKAGAGG